MAREEMKFTCYIGHCQDGFELFFLFYPNGVWDEDTMLKDEALEKYPLAKYKWVFID